MASPHSIHCAAAALVLLALGCLSLSSCSSTRELTPEELADARDIDNLLRMYVEGDPGWAQARDTALRDPNKAGLLIDRFIYAMDEAWRREHPVGVLLPSSKSGRFQAELIAMAPTSIPHLILGLRTREDRVAPKWVVDTLARIGASALPALHVRFAETSDSQEKVRILATISEMAQPGEIEFLIRSAVDADWRVRAQALVGCGILAGQAGASAEQRDHVRQTLKDHLTQDQDAFVRWKAAEGLAALGDVESMRCLIDRFKALAEFTSREELQERGKLLVTLQHATGLLKARQVAEFEGWLARRESER